MTPLRPSTAATPIQSAGARTREEGLRFAQRMRTPRTLGLALGVICVAATLYQNGAHPVVFAALAVNGFVWPHVAWFLAARSAEPHRTEIRNLLADSAAGGVWIALMAFNLLPSALLFAMLTMDKISVGGLRLAARAMLAQAVACGLTVLLFGFDFRPVSTMWNVIASLPLLVGYPIAVGVATHRLSRRIREQNRTLAELSRTDGLSGLLNRGYWEHLAVAELKRHRRNGNPVALLMLDIDHFKQVNDRHGHPAGDEVIRMIAGLVRDTVREQDTVGRYGGEEFGVILPDTSLAGAHVIAERVRTEVEAAIFDVKGGIRCTVSIGVAEASADVFGVPQWVEHADRALYRAKALGRNRTVQFDPGMPPADSKPALETVSRG